MKSNSQLPLMVARRFYADQGDSRKVSRPAIRTAIAGVAIGLAVMLITVSVVLGFKHTIRDKVVGFGCHIQVENFLSMQTSDHYPICIGDSMMQVLKGLPDIRHVQRYALTQGILKTDDDFLGISFKGVGEEYDMDFIRQNLQEGEIPHFSNSKSSQKVVISRMVADKLQLKTGDAVYAYFIREGDVRARKFTVSGIFATNMTRFDESLCFTDLNTTVRLNNWQEDCVSGAEMTVNDFDRLEETAGKVVAKVNRTQDPLGNTFMSQTIYDAYPQIFSWLELLDINVWIILGLMICVAGFTMISGLLIIILERTQTIGILKALGAGDRTIRHTFLWFAVFIIGRGMLIGNIVGLGLIFLQKQTGLIRLDASNYYVNTAPMEIHWPFFLLLNAATLLITILVLIAPSMLVSHISPAKSMRYE